MGTLSISLSSPANCTTKIRWKGLQVQGVVLSDRLSRQLPVSRAVLKNSLSESRKALAVGICQTCRLSSSSVNPGIPHQWSMPKDSTATDFGRNQESGWSESSCDEGSALYSNSLAAAAAAAAVDVGYMGTSAGGSEGLLIERLLESLPIYDQGRSAEHYRIRALVYGTIGDYFSKGEGRAQRYGGIDDKQGAMDVKVLTAVLQLADLILAEDGRTAADYNSRAQFFQKSAEMFCGGGDGKRPEALTGERERVGSRGWGEFCSSWRM